MVSTPPPRPPVFHECLTGNISRSHHSLMNFSQGFNLCYLGLFNFHTSTLLHIWNFCFYLVERKLALSFIFKLRDSSFMRLSYGNFSTNTADVTWLRDLPRSFASQVFGKRDFLGLEGSYMYCRLLMLTCLGLPEHVHDKINHTPKTKIEWLGTR